MSDVVANVARAIWALMEDTDCHDYDRLAPHAKARADEMARAAIDAMRKTTKGMVAAGQRTLMGNIGVNIDVGYPYDEASQDVWDAMIDEALKDD